MKPETYRIIPYYGYNYGHYYPINSTGQFQQSRAVGIKPPPGDIAVTPIEAKYGELIRGGFVGTPIIPESTAPDGVGRYRHYRNGGGEWSIYWHPDTGAYEVYGAIRAKWASLGWERYGYPFRGEATTDGRGRYQYFVAVHLPGKPRPAILWTPQFGAYAVYGAILSKYEDIGSFHSGPLGYPISDEHDRPGGGRIQRFEKGSIIWTPETGAYVEQSTTPTVPTTSPTTPPTVSYSTVSIYNCHTDRRSIIIWVNDGSGLHPVATLDHQYNDYGTCPAGEPHVLELKNGVWNHVVCVDVGAIGCGVNDPTQGACRRYEFSLLGNSNGPEFPTPVIVN